MSRLVFAFEFEEDGRSISSRADYLYGVLAGLIARGRDEGIVGPDVQVVTAPDIRLPESDRQNIERALQETGKDPASWWSARFLQLAAHSDPVHLEALRFAAPDHIEAWERWRSSPYSDPGWRDAAEGQWEKDHMRDPRA